MKKCEKGSATLIVFVTVMFILIVLSTIFTTAYMKSKSQLIEMQAIRNTYDGDLASIFKERIQGEANLPVLKTGMTAVKYSIVGENETSAIEITDEDDKAWYDYKNKLWANAQTEDGSLWVWIPRFAYKITYYTDSNKTTIAETKTQYGSIDVKFLVGTTDNYFDDDGNLQTAQRCESETTVVDTTTDYTVHPAFTNEESIEYRNGGWDDEITGFWVAKFEAGYANAISNGTETLNGVTVKSASNKNIAPIKASTINYSQDNVWANKEETGTENNGTVSARNWLDGIYDSVTTAIKYPTFQGSTYSMNYINHNDAYNISKALTEEGNIYGLKDSEADSHLMKNSEWGAVAYLAQSQYGLNGKDIELNSYNANNTPSSVYAVTGYNSDSKEWNNGGQTASTTGTIYGVYDLSGGALERTAGYIANGSESLKEYGEDLTYSNNILNKKSNKYVTVYPYNSSSDTNTNNYSQINKIYGDAVYETSTGGSGLYGWFANYTNLVYGDEPFFGRGCSYTNEGIAGLFSFSHLDGNSSYSTGFRAVII